MSHFRVRNRGHSPWVKHGDPFHRDTYLCDLVPLNGLRLYLYPYLDLDRDLYPDLCRDHRLYPYADRNSDMFVGIFYHLVLPLLLLYSPSLLPV